ncbi:MAG TPA: OmpA family protein [Puia sp.]|jgi:OOP family OmpA-OmpF porin|nr:OmpA family protein [Puia sp.]
MNRKLPLLLLALITVSLADAQIKLDAFIGIHSASVAESNKLSNWNTNFKPFYSSRTGIAAGFLVDIPVGQKGFSFQPGINYASKGRHFFKNYDTANAATDTLSLKTALNMGYIEMPLNLAYKMFLSSSHKSIFFISAGPYFAFIYNANMNNQTLSVSNGSSVNYQSGSEDLLVGNAVNKYKTMDIGLNAKAGFEFGNVILSCYASRGLTNFYTAPYAGTFHHEVFGASLGIWIAKTQTKAVPHATKIAVKDSDNDGVPDDKDLCPNVPGLAKYNGCPVPDTDGDGIDDEHDSCKTIPGIEKYHGCPVPDTDGDGIDDEHDSCKTIPGIEKYHGCPVPDTDGDGIDDEHDSCKTVPGIKENNGCPAIKNELKEKVNYVARNILFSATSDKLTKDSYPGLDELVTILKSEPTIRLAIHGYTDTTGTPRSNLVLSQKRANAVKKYLLTKGIPLGRVSAFGHGQENPIADNRSEAGRAANRRVELKLTSNE